jgi:hypothetical protein
MVKCTMKYMCYHFLPLLIFAQPTFSAHFGAVHGLTKRSTFTGGYALLAPCCLSGRFQCGSVDVISCCLTGTIYGAFGCVCCLDCKNLITFLRLGTWLTPDYSKGLLRVGPGLS